MIPILYCVNNVKSEMTGLNLCVYIPHASIAVFFQPCPWGKKDTNLNKKCVFKKKKNITDIGSL